MPDTTPTDQPTLLVKCGEEVIQVRGLEEATRVLREHGASEYEIERLLGRYADEVYRRAQEQS